MAKTKAAERRELAKAVTHGLPRAGRLLIWLVATALVAAVTARAVVKSEAVGPTTAEANGSTPAASRHLVTVASQTIRPTLDGDGTVVALGNGFDIQASISDADQAYRLVTHPPQVRALITGGPVGFPCQWHGLIPGPDGSPLMTCTVPRNIKVVAGLSATMVITLHAPLTTLALPTTAVIGSAVQGDVISVNANGHRSAKLVRLGVSDSNWVQVLSGVGAGTKVLQSPTQADLDSL